ncbi:MAG: S41 family peptidase [Fimbriimonadaceae bacterium]
MPLLLAGSSAIAQLEPPTLEPVVGARNLALSADGTRLAFSWRGDIWVVSSQGGQARAITSHVELEDWPVWSPCGKWIAFTSNRSGNNDVYVVPSEGGQVRRLTWFAGNDIARDWSRDGRHLLLLSQRDKPWESLYTLDVATTQVRELSNDVLRFQFGRFSPAGNEVLVSRAQGAFAWFRPRYEGSGNHHLVTIDMLTGRRNDLRNNGFQHLWPSYSADGQTIYTVTVSEKTPSASTIDRVIPRIVDNPNRTPNIYAVARNGSARRLTDYVGGAGTRFLTAAASANLLAFEREGSLFTMVPGNRPTRINVVAGGDDRTTDIERLVLTTGATEGALSPKADKVVFTVRNELWMTPVRRGRGPNANDATQLTSWAGLDRQPIWLPDNRHILFTSDRDGSERVFRLDTETKKVEPVTQTDQDALELKLTPDKKHVSFWLSGEGGGLFRVRSDGGEPELVMPLRNQFRFEFPTAYSFSPDGRWLAYTRAGGRGTVNVWIYDTVEKTDHNVTRLNVSHANPVWSGNGKYLYFMSNRNGNGIHILPLQEEPRRFEELELKYEKPTETPKVEIDFERISERIRRFNAQAQGSLTTDPESGEIYFLAEGDLYRVSYDGETTTRITQGGGVASYQLSDDLKQALLVRNGNVQLVNLRQQGYPVTNLPFRADWTRDLMLERRAAFAQFWREYNRGFYDGNFHGRDWNEIRRRYEPLLAGVGHRNDFAILLNMMVGELEASHAEVGPAPASLPSVSSAHPAFTFDYSHQGPGIKILEVPTGTPGSFEKTKLEPGEYVLQINGVDVRLDEALWRDVLNEQTGREITLTVNKTPTKEGARTVTYRAWSPGQFNGHMNNLRIESRRRFVEERSNGQLTYVNIAGMGAPNFDLFSREVWEFVDGKKGAIIDVRFNGGGNISGRLLDVLERVPVVRGRVRDGLPYDGRGEAWALPTIVMIGPRSLSDAEMFPYMMKQRGIATLLGEPTPGYVIGTYSLTLVDGTSARMPTWGVFRMDGTSLENLGERPDIRVPMDNDAFIQGDDRQLARAVDELMRRIR